MPYDDLFAKCFRSFRIFNAMQIQASELRISNFCKSYKVVGENFFSLPCTCFSQPPTQLYFFHLLSLTEIFYIRILFKEFCWNGILLRRCSHLYWFNDLFKFDLFLSNKIHLFAQCLQGCWVCSCFWFSSFFLTHWHPLNPKRIFHHFVINVNICNRLDWIKRDRKSSTNNFLLSTFRQMFCVRAGSEM